MKLWQKSKDSLEAVSQFTAGKDSEMDVFLIPYDIQGSLAHIAMLNQVGLLSDTDWSALSAELKKIHADALNGKINIEPGVEDIHSQIEIELTRRLGEAGKKIHLSLIHI
jgi:argininosuccinate lyase